MRGHRKSDPCKIVDERRCQALTRDCWNQPTNDRCHNHAHYIVKGKRLCGRHAAWYWMEVSVREGNSAIKVMKFAKPPQNDIRFAGKDEC